MRERTRKIAKQEISTLSNLGGGQMLNVLETRERPNYDGITVQETDYMLNAMLHSRLRYWSTNCS